MEFATHREHKKNSGKTLVCKKPGHLKNSEKRGKSRRREYLKKSHLNNSGVVGNPGKALKIQKNVTVEKNGTFEK